MGDLSPTVLAFDTSAAHCAAAVLKDGSILAERLEPMERGQAERLMPLLEEMLAESKISWRDLDAVGVGVGPGSFTGVRIAVSAARGLALTLGVPAIGVSNFELMHDLASPAGAPITIVSLPAPRGQAYVQEFRDGAPQSPPKVIDPTDASAVLDLEAGAVVLGHHATDVARSCNANALDAELAEIGGRIARAAARKFAPGETPNRPVPLYIRPADAAPPREAPPAILP